MSVFRRILAEKYDHDCRNLHCRFDLETYQPLAALIAVVEPRPQAAVASKRLKPLVLCSPFCIQTRGPAYRASCSTAHVVSIGVMVSRQIRRIGVAVYAGALLMSADAGANPARASDAVLVFVDQATVIRLPERVS